MMAAVALDKEQGFSVSPAVASALVLCFAAIIIRWPNFGNPNYHVDEQFYLLVGRSMLDGAIPYVDIWDRKPLGLFLLYAGIGLLGGDGIYQYQAVAGLFAAGTAITIALIARRFAGWVPATLAGITYIVSLEIMAGGGGQSPVFYNLFIALAFLKFVRSNEARQADRSAIIAMVLCSLAVFIKPTAIPESLMIGALFLWKNWSYHACKWRIANLIIKFALIGFAPHALTIAFYAAIGHFDDWLFANITSIFVKSGSTSGELSRRAFHLLILVWPLVAFAFAGWARIRRQPEAIGLALWFGASIVGFAMVPNVFHHYALPLAVPMSVLAGGLYSRGLIGALYAFFGCFWMLSLAQFPALERTKLSIIGTQEAVRSIKANLGDGCMYIYQGPTYLYELASACRMTSRLFPEHLSTVRESRAIGLDAAAEVKRILDAKPNVIITAPVGAHDAYNPATLSQMQRVLARDYRHVRTIKMATSSMIGTKMDIYVRIRPAESPGLIHANGASPGHPR